MRVLGFIRTPTDSTQLLSLVIHRQNASQRGEEAHKTNNDGMWIQHWRQSHFERKQAALVLLGALVQGHENELGRVLASSR